MPILRQPPRYCICYADKITVSKESEKAKLLINDFVVSGEKGEQIRREENLSVQKSF